MRFEFSQHIFEEISNIKFPLNPSSGSRVVLCERTDGRTYMTKLIVDFRNFANENKKTAFSYPTFVILSQHD